jgi:hypothetical protein
VFDDFRVDYNRIKHIDNFDASRIKGATESESLSFVTFYVEREDLEEAAVRCGFTRGL